MPFELKLAFKYFRAKRKSLARFTSVVAILGIAVGVASLIIAQSLAKGFQDEMREKILANTAHISVFLTKGGEISDFENVKAKLETLENVEIVTPTAFENALIIGETDSSYAILKVQSPKSKVQSPKEISVGKVLAEKLNLKPNDIAEIVTLENQTPTRVRVAETFSTGLYDYDAAWIYVSPEGFARLNKTNNFTPTHLSVSVKDIYKTAETSQNLREILGENYKILDWQEANRPLFAALSLEKKVSFAVISLIIFIAVLNITTTLALLVNERKLDIAVLRTCGAKTKSLVFIFLIEGLILGAIGIFVGILLGISACLIANYFKLVSIAEEVYSLNYIPLKMDFLNILQIVFAAFLLCLLATIYPAIRASRIKPLENLRNQ
ncbi:MAG TPA: ABC transporter permease [Pyrinomonadaceae bacterium]|nr:ABC transporter permease [Pyrinomonadaceae bacterium]